MENNNEKLMLMCLGTLEIEQNLQLGVYLMEENNERYLEVIVFKTTKGKSKYSPLVIQRKSIEIKKSAFSELDLFQTTKSQLRGDKEKK